MCYNYSNLVSGIIASMLAIIIALLYFFGIITNIIPSLIVAVITAFLIGFSFVGIIINKDYNKCARKYNHSILIGGIGTLIFSTILLSLTLTVDLLSTILIGLQTFFFIYLIISFIKFIYCIIYFNNEYSIYCNLHENEYIDTSSKE